jgi:hypothetical protein
MSEELESLFVDVHLMLVRAVCDGGTADVFESNSHGQ